MRFFGAVLFLGLSWAQAAVQFSYSDHLGSTAVETNEAGEAQQIESYFPFGEISHEIRDTKYTSRFFYTGQELDRSSDLYYYGARYYDPTLARFTSTDPVIENPSYAYVLNNPLRFIDPSGMDEQPIPRIRATVSAEEAGQMIDLYRESRREPVGITVDGDILPLDIPGDVQWKGWVSEDLMPTVGDIRYLSSKIREPTPFTFVRPDSETFTILMVPGRGKRLDILFNQPDGIYHTRRFKPRDSRTPRVKGPKGIAGRWWQLRFSGNTNLLNTVTLSPDGLMSPPGESGRYMLTQQGGLRVFGKYGLNAAAGGEIDPSNPASKSIPLERIGEWHVRTRPEGPNIPASPEILATSNISRYLAGGMGVFGLMYELDQFGDGCRGSYCE